MHKQLTTEERLLELIATDLLKVETLIDNDIKYPEIPLDELFERIKGNYTVLQKMRRHDVAVGDWVQLHIGGSEPVYAKVTSFHPTDPKLIILSGMHNHADMSPNAFPKENALPVSLEVGRALEFANGNNKRMF